MTKPYIPQDKNGHPLKVGDRVTVSRYTKKGMVPCEASIIAIHFRHEWDETLRKNVPGQSAFLECRRSAKDRSCIYQDDKYTTYVGPGPVISREEVEAAEAARKAKPKKPKAFKPQVPHLICFIMEQSKEPLTSEEIRRRLHALQGKQGAYNPSSNTCYFGAGDRGWQASASLINKGYIKRGKDYTFILTPEGHKMAAAYRDWKNS